MPGKLKKIIEGGMEVVKDSAKQLAQTVSPDAFAKQILGTPRTSEFTEYLKKQGPDLSPEEIEKKKKEFQTDEEKKLEAARKTIKAAIPDHMKLLQKQTSTRPYEVSIQEEERKKAMQVEMQKKQPQPMATPAGKQQRGSLFARKKKTAKGFEGMQKDTKVG